MIILYLIASWLGIGLLLFALVVIICQFQIHCEVLRGQAAEEIQDPTAESSSRATS